MHSDLTLPSSGQAGFCYVTKAGEGAECGLSDVKGSWRVPSIAACVAKCTRCERCRYISYGSKDCDWYQHCPRLYTTLGRNAVLRLTFQVRDGNGTVVALDLSATPRNVTYHGLTVGHLLHPMGSDQASKTWRTTFADRPFKPKERSRHEAVLENLQEACKLEALLENVQENRRLERPPVLVIGTLSPANDKAIKLRRWHRAAHCAQANRSMLVRYVISVQEARDAMTARLGVGADSASATLAGENSTFRDIHVVPTLPRGFGWSTDTAPPGAGCALKLLSWLQLACSIYRNTPYIAYGDLDSLWVASRVLETLTRHLAPVDAWVHPLYAGGMMYTSLWDFSRMLTPGVAAFSSRRAFDQRNEAINASNANISSAYPQYSDLLHRLTHPIIFAHGMSPILSQALARQLLRLRADVRAFFEMYNTTYVDSPQGRESVGLARRNTKCVLAGDETIGLFVSLIPSVIALDLPLYHLNIHNPSPQKVCSPHVWERLSNLHGYHLGYRQWRLASNWLYLLNVTTDPRSHPLLPARLVCMPGSAPSSRRLVARLDSKMDGTVRTTRLHSTLSAIGNVYARLHPERISEAHPAGFGPGIDWVLCGVNCHGEPHREAEPKCRVPVWGIAQFSRVLQ